MVKQCPKLNQCLKQLHCHEIYTKSDPNRQWIRFFLNVIQCNNLDDLTNNSIYDIECLLVSKWPNYGQRNWRLKNCAKIDVSKKSFGPCEVMSSTFHFWTILVWLGCPLHSFRCMVLSGRSEQVVKPSPFNTRCLKYCYQLPCYIQKCVFSFEIMM